MIDPGLKYAEINGFARLTNTTLLVQPCLFASIYMHAHLCSEEARPTYYRTLGPNRVWKKYEVRHTSLTYARGVQIILKNNSSKK